MKLIQKEIVKNYNQDNEISNSEIFTRKSEMIAKDNTVIEVKKFADDGLFSPRIFGELETEETYSCGCGKYKGKVFEGLTCDDPNCPNPEVKLIEANIDKFGWINLDGTFVINYIPYMILEKIIGRDHLRKIIDVLDTITIEGNLDTDVIDGIRSTGEYQKYYYIGIPEFKDNYLEILKHYFALNNPKLVLPDEYDFLSYEDVEAKTDLDDTEKKRILGIYKTKERKIYSFLLDQTHVFTDKIPVISTVLRPAVRTADGLKMDEINYTYINILKSVKILKEKVDIITIIKNSTILRIQALYFQLSEEIVSNIKSKNGLIRNQICGTRVNFSARNIISPARSGYKIDELVLPYITFLHLYKFEIINILSRIKNVKFADANEIWFRATIKLDEEVYTIMKKMIADEEIGVLLNRNPTISYGSILYLRVAGIKHNYDDFTMSVHNGILSLLAGDYDGDVLNVISLKDSETKQVFRDVFSPISLMIDSNNGEFNRSLNLERDQILGINSLLI